MNQLRTWRCPLPATAHGQGVKRKVGVATAGSAFITFLAYSFGPVAFAKGVSLTGAYGPVYAFVSALGLVAAAALLIVGRRPRT